MKPGEQWRPYSGSDGVFMEEICCHCVHDQAYQAGEGDSCEIAAAMYRDAGSPEWIIGLEGKPFCKQFKREGQGYRCTATKDMFP